MSRHRHHHHHDHDHDEHDRDHHHDQHHDHGRARLQHALRRHLRRHGDDVDALEGLQRDLEQAAADVAARVTKLRAASGEPVS